MKPDIEPPTIPEGLVEFLLLTFRDRLPLNLADATPENIARLIGQQEVIRHLAELKVLQEESDNVST